VVYITSADGYLYALNASNGAKVWSYFTSPLRANAPSSPTVANGVVYFGAECNCTAGFMDAVNANTGALLWSYLIPDSNTAAPAAPAVTNGAVYFGDDAGYLYALNASTGAPLWNYRTGSTVRSAPVVANGIVYIGSWDGNVYALNASTGALLWSTAKEPGIDSVFSSPAVANGVVYYGSEDYGGAALTGHVYALNVSTGAQLWSLETGGPVVSSPAVANGVVYVGSADGNLHALNANTGAELWSYAQGAGWPAVVDGVLYVNSGYLFAFGLGGTADLYLRIRPTPTTVSQGDLLTYAIPVWNLGPGVATQEVLTTQVPEGTTFDYIRISGTPGLGTCTTPPYQGTGEIVCHENSAMAPNTTWTVRLIVKVTAPSGTVITENATATEDTTDPNLANNTATVSTTVQ